MACSDLGLTSPLGHSSAHKGKGIAFCLIFYNAVTCSPSLDFNHTPAKLAGKRKAGGLVPVLQMKEQTSQRFLICSEVPNPVELEIVFSLPGHSNSRAAKPQNQ